MFDDIGALVDHILIGGFGFARDLTPDQISGLNREISRLRRVGNHADADQIIEFMDSMGVRSNQFKEGRMRITKSQIKKIVREARDSMGMSEYGLYEKPGAEVIEAELDALMDEVSEFMKDARQRLNNIIEAGTKFGANDTESLYQIDDAFKKAVLSQL